MKTYQIDKIENVLKFQNLFKINIKYSKFFYRITKFTYGRLLFFAFENKFYLGNCKNCKNKQIFSIGTIIKTFEKFLIISIEFYYRRTLLNFTKECKFNPNLLKTVKNNFVNSKSYFTTEVKFN